MNGDVNRFNRGAFTVGRWSLAAVRLLFAFVALMVRVVVATPIVGVQHAYEYFAGKRWLGPEPPWGQGRIREKYHIRRLELGEAWHGITIASVGFVFWFWIALMMIQQFLGSTLTGGWAIAVLTMMGVVFVGALTTFVSFITSVVLSRQSKRLLKSAEDEYAWMFGAPEKRIL